MKRKTIYFTIIVILVAIGVFISFKNLSNSDNNVGVPKKPIHWHPKLKIIIKGEEQFIPSNIGISIGNNIDN